MKLNVVDFFEQGALRNFPAHTAIVDGERSLTFDELAADAKCLSLIHI